MKERNLARYFSLAALVAMGAICIGLYYFAFTLPSATPAPIKPATATATAAPTRTPASSPVATPTLRPSATPTPMPTPMPTATATPLPVKTVIKTSMPRPTPTMTATATPEGCHIETNQIYIIRRGDNLSKISECAYGNPYRWVELCDFNGLMDCDVIHAGNSLVIPDWWR